MNQRVLKQEVHSELKAQYTEFFESKLAVTLLRSLESFPTVSKISKIICSLILENKEKLDQVEANLKVREELYQRRYFGRLSEKGKESGSILAAMVEVLSNDKAAFNQVMQIHCIFTYRIYPLLNAAFAKEMREQSQGSKESQRIDLRKAKLEAATALPEKISSLIMEYENHYEPTRQLGIMRTEHNRVFSKLIGNSGTRHARAVDRFIPDCQSRFFKTISPKSIPFVAGPSGHTASLILGSLFYGLKEAEELKEYALACFAFLAAGGNHSFHEVMIAANRVAQVPHELVSYDKSLPESFKRTITYRELARQFPEYLEGVSDSSLKLLY